MDTYGIWKTVVDSGNGEFSFFLPHDMMRFHKSVLEGKKNTPKWSESPNDKILSI